jgi:hypothetical protein
VFICSNPWPRYLLIKFANSLFCVFAIPPVVSLRAKVAQLERSKKIALTTSPITSVTYKNNNPRDPRYPPQNLSEDFGHGLPLDRAGSFSLSCLLSQLVGGNSRPKCS